jgi:chaperonin cofactor prefoldin
MQPETFIQLITPASILLGIVFSAGRVKSAIDELRRAVDKLENAVRFIEARTHDVEQRLSRLEGKAE